MPSTTDFEFGDVVLVGFPFTNLKTVKKRPAVVISQKQYQQNRPDVILLAITSQIRLPLATGELIIKDWEAAGLVKPSLFKPLIATVEQRCIVKNMGRLTGADKNGLNQLLGSIIGQ